MGRVCSDVANSVNLVHYRDGSAGSGTSWVCIGAASQANAAKLSESKIGLRV